MEKKKLLFVAISVGIFLVIAIGAAFLVFRPSAAPGTMAGSPAGPGVTWTPSSYYTGPSAAPGIAGPGIFQTAPVDAVDLVRGAEDMPGLRTLPDGTSQQAGDFLVQGQRSTETMIRVPNPTTAAVPETPPAGRAAPPSPPQTTQVRTPPAQAAPAPQARPAQQTSRPAPAPATVAVAASQPRARAQAAQTGARNDYWVQTGAFSTVANAEGVRESLASKGITSIIDNRIIDGRHLFRVRVGPYTSASEANYWLTLIRSIDGFENSQVRQTQTLN